MPAPRHMRPLLRLHPRGHVDLSEGSNAWLDLVPLAQVLDVAQDTAQDLVAELLPDATSTLVADWERVYGLRHVAGKTLQQRRNALRAARMLLPDFARSTIEQLVERYTNLAVTLLEPGPFAVSVIPGTAACDASDDLVDGAFVFVLDFSWWAAHTAGLDRDEIEDWVDAIKPAHTCCLVRFDDFHVDDPLSVTNRDLLGA